MNTKLMTTAYIYHTKYCPPGYKIVPVNILRTTERTITIEKLPDIYKTNYKTCKIGKDIFLTLEDVKNYLINRNNKTIQANIKENEDLLVNNNLIEAYGKN